MNRHAGPQHAGTLLIRAGYLLTPGQPIRPQSALLIHDGRIRAIAPFSQLARRYPPGSTHVSQTVSLLDAGDCIVMPGLVNAHTHLDLSDLHQQVPYHGDFIDWLLRIVQYRRSNPPDNQPHIIRHAAQQSLQFGVTLIADISYDNQSRAVLRQLPLRKVCFAELFGQDSDLPHLRQSLDRFLSQTTADPRLTPGLAPHAPYSVAPQLYEFIAAHAAQHHLPMTTHLAESPAEIDLFQHGSSQWLPYFAAVNRWQHGFPQPGLHPVRWLCNLNLAGKKILLAHVNVAGPEELQLLARQGHSVVYCPRSHAFFDHPPHPWLDMLRLGINVCIGTDSLASNHDLSILREIRLLHQLRPDVSPDTLLRLATVNAARALDCPDTGSLAPGLHADIIALPFTGSAKQAQHEFFHLPDKPRWVMIAGRLAYQSDAS